MGYILFGLWYLFMITLSFKGMEKLKIGFGEYWYGVYKDWGVIKPDHDITNCIGGFFGSIIWPITWLFIGMSKLSGIIINRAMEEIKEGKETK